MGDTWQTGLTRGRRCICQSPHLLQPCPVRPPPPCLSFPPFPLLTSCIATSSRAAAVDNEKQGTRKMRVISEELRTVQSNAECSGSGKRGGSYLECGQGRAVRDKNAAGASSKTSTLANAHRGPPERPCARPRASTPTLPTPFPPFKANWQLTVGLPNVVSPVLMSTPAVQPSAAVR